jgi:H+/gluconate symporter-like permease
MDLSTGTMLFYGGLAGTAATILAALIAAVLLARGNKKIKRKLNQEYGEKLK